MYTYFRLIVLPSHGTSTSFKRLQSRLDAPHLSFLRDGGAFQYICPLSYPFLALNHDMGHELVSRRPDGRSEFHFVCVCISTDRM
jgi:hypothetical protein